MVGRSRDSIRLGQALDRVREAGRLDSFDDSSADGSQHVFPVLDIRPVQAARMVAVAEHIAIHSDRLVAVLALASLEVVHWALSKKLNRI